ncbi:hypothetical protein M0804_006404 [Polistes exclamans]|nr:hypothetical protein M0804_006404 [Polistes exclamans]
MVSTWKSQRVSRVVEGSVSFFARKLKESMVRRYRLRNIYQQKENAEKKNKNKDEAAVEAEAEAEAEAEEEEEEEEKEER